MFSRIIRYVIHIGLPFQVHTIAAAFEPPPKKHATNQEKKSMYIHVIMLYQIFTFIFCSVKLSRRGDGVFSVTVSPHE